MKFRLITIFFLIGLCPGLACADSSTQIVPQKTNALYQSEDSQSEDISLRFHAQWRVDDGTRKKLHEQYGAISFDKRGHPILHGLSSAQRKRWERLYALCMNDGCYYCDADEGSCELGTCGAHNEHCKPHLGQDGQPVCGRECADFALMSVLICNDRS